jgi:hypothetical protein
VALRLEDKLDKATDSPFWQSIARLYNRTWFWRLWVVQEVVLASDAVVRLDGAEMLGNGLG